MRHTMRPYIAPYKGSRKINIYIPKNICHHLCKLFSVIYQEDISEQLYPRIRN